MSLITTIEWDETDQQIINNSEGKNNSKTSDFKMSGDGNLGYHSQDTSHSSSHHFNDGGISDDASLGVSVVDGRCEYRSLETIHFPSLNCGV